MPTEVHNESLCTINFPRRLSRAESGWSCHLRAVAFSDPLMLVSQGEGGRREGLVLGGGNPVWPVCRYIYIPPAGGPGEAAEQPSRARSHTSTWLSVGLRFLSSKLHVCEKEGKPRLTPQRQHTSGSHFNCTPRLAVWLPSVLTIRAGGSGHLETFTVSQVYQTMPEWLGTRERRSTMARTLEEQTGVPGAQNPIRLSKMTTKMARKRLFCLPISNYSGPRKVTSLSTACNRGSLLLRRLAQDKGQSY